MSGKQANNNSDPKKNGYHFYWIFFLLQASKQNKTKDPRESQTKSKFNNINWRSEPSDQMTNFQNWSILAARESKKKWNSISFHHLGQRERRDRKTCCKLILLILVREILKSTPKWNPSSPYWRHRFASILHPSWILGRGPGRESIYWKHLFLMMCVCVFVGRDHGTGTLVDWIIILPWVHWLWWGPGEWQFLINTRSLVLGGLGGRGTRAQSSSNLQSNLFWFKLWANTQKHQTLIYSAQRFSQKGRPFPGVQIERGFFEEFCFLPLGFSMLNSMLIHLIFFWVRK